MLLTVLWHILKKDGEKSEEVALWDKGKTQATLKNLRGMNIMKVNGLDVYKHGNGGIFRQVAK